MGPKALAIKTTIVVLLLALSVGGISVESRADSDNATRSHWGVLKFQGMYSWPLGDNHVEAWNTCDDSFFSFLDFYSSINVNNSVGVLGSFEYVLARRYGFEATFMYWHKVVDLKFEATGITIEGAPNFILPVLGFNFHFFTDRKTDLYAGPLVGLGVIATGWGYDNLEITKDVALGLNLALDYYLDDSWSIGGGLKYLDFGTMNFSIFPPGYGGFICNNGLFGIGNMRLLSASLGVGYKF